MGPSVGLVLGDDDGDELGALLFVGLSLGADEGKKLPDGDSLREPDGASDGEELGLFDGA